MRFNDKELAFISSQNADLEGRLNYRKIPNGNFSQSGSGRSSPNKPRCIDNNYYIRLVIPVTLFTATVIEFHINYTKT